MDISGVCGRSEVLIGNALTADLDTLVPLIIDGSVLEV